MKKLSLIFTILTITFTTGHTQEYHLGARAGLNFATIQPDLTDPAIRTSIHFGGLIEIPLMDSFSIQPELLFSSQGVKDQSDSDEKITLDYLTIPLLAKYYIWNTLSLEAGPQIGFLLSARREDDGETDDLKDISKAMDIGIAFGLGYKLPGGIILGARYYFGSNINAIEDNEDRIKNRVFQLSAGYFFN
jgi:hypothetical protein